MRKITPFLWFDNNAQEAMNFYVSIFKNSKVISSDPMSVRFELEGQEFFGLNGGPVFHFNEAISLYVDCADQKEVDELWAKLLAGGGRESQCGWLADKFGLSWQIIPRALSDYLSDPDRDKAGRVMQAMMGMVKIDVDGLKRAYEGR